jgi:nuclear transport factor 2 (NTF2) superfamily protein
MAGVERRPPVPPFTHETALAKVKAAEIAWNSRNPEVVALAYTKDSEWRNRTEFFQGREAIKEFLTRKWAQELDYHLMKELWSYTDNHIAVRFEYEWRNEAGEWYVSLPQQIIKFHHLSVKNADALVIFFPKRVKTQWFHVLQVPDAWK